MLCGNIGEIKNNGPYGKVQFKKYVIDGRVIYTDTAVVGDFNCDGRQDIAFFARIGNSLTIYENITNTNKPVLE